VAATRLAGGDLHDQQHASMQLQEVVGAADHLALSVVGLFASPREAPDATDLFDLAEDRLGP
jgi:hypothetical protein